MMKNAFFTGQRVFSCCKKYGQKFRQPIMARYSVTGIPEHSICFIVRNLI